METDILDSLTNVGYSGSLLEPNAFSLAVGDPKISPEFRNLVAWITEEISGLAELDERVSMDDDVNTFMLELSGFLKEMQCPYEDFMRGTVSSRFQTPELRLRLLDFLLTELMAQKMVGAIKGVKSKPDLSIELQATPTAKALTEICRALNLGKPPDNITPKALFDKINSRLDEVIKQHDGLRRLGKPLFDPQRPLSDQEWAKVEEIQKEFDEEYNLRRKMLLTRLDCTIQSFLWSERIQPKSKEITEIYAKHKAKLDKYVEGGSRTDVTALLAARDNLAVMEKTSSANVRKNTKSKLQRHIIGRVPDRGGRAYEHAPPPPEMPSWQKQRAGGPAGGGGGRGGGRGGNQGNWNQNRGQGSGSYHQQQQERNRQGGYNQNQGHGGYNQGQSYQNQGGFQQNQGGYSQGQSRVQGGWSQRGHDDRRGSGGGGGYDDRQQYQQRGRSNYNRGGRR